MSSLVMIKWTIKKGINPTQMQEVATKKRKKNVCINLLLFTPNLH